jgi:hypothetical protein
MACYIESFIFPLLSRPRTLNFEVHVTGEGEVEKVNENEMKGAGEKEEYIRKEFQSNMIKLEVR